MASGDKRNDKKKVVSIKNYNDWERKNILNIEKNNIHDIIDQLKLYIDKYHDYSACNLLADKLITVGRFEEADYYLSEFERQINSSYGKNFHNKEMTIIKNKRIRFRYYCRIKDANKVLELLDRDKVLLREADGMETQYCCQIGVYFRKMLGLTNYDINRCYKYQQLFEYDYDRFLDHIKKHYNDSDSMSDDTLNMDCYFNADFPLDDILEEVKKYVPSDKKYYDGYVTDAYFFKFNNCGKVSGKSTDHFAVITYADSDKYITMYPTSHGITYNCIDLNYVIDRKKDCNVKSGLQRFREKYSYKL